MLCYKAYVDHLETTLGIPSLTGLERFNSTHWKSGEKVIDLDHILSVGHADPRFRSLGPDSRSWMPDLLRIVCRSDVYRELWKSCIQLSPRKLYPIWSTYRSWIGQFQTRISP